MWHCFLCKTSAVGWQVQWVVLAWCIHRLVLSPASPPHNLAIKLKIVPNVKLLKLWSIISIPFPNHQKKLCNPPSAHCRIKKNKISGTQKFSDVIHSCVPLIHPPHLPTGVAPVVTEISGHCITTCSRCCIPCVYRSPYVTLQLTYPCLLPKIMPSLLLLW